MEEPSSAGRGKLKAAWLADAVAKLDKKKSAEEDRRLKKNKRSKHRGHGGAQGKSQKTRSKELPCVLCAPCVKSSSALRFFIRAAQAPHADGNLSHAGDFYRRALRWPDWLFEIKWDGYRAVAFIENGKVRLVSRNQNELTARYPELKDLPQFVKAKTRNSRWRSGRARRAGPTFVQPDAAANRISSRRPPRRQQADVPVLYYAFDLLYLDGYDWRRVPLEERKKKLASMLIAGDSLRYSDHYEREGKALFEIAREKGLEGILAKKRDSIYQERRSSEWLKIKIRHRTRVRHRRIHRAGRQPRTFRFHRPRAL